MIYTLKVKSHSKVPYGLIGAAIGGAAGVGLGHLKDKKMDPNESYWDRNKGKIIGGLSGAAIGGGIGGAISNRNKLKHIEEVQGKPMRDFDAKMHDDLKKSIDLYGYGSKEHYGLLDTYKGMRKSMFKDTLPIYEKNVRSAKDRITNNLALSGLGALGVGLGMSTDDSKRKKSDK